ncbi:unnamed protein product, partial [Mesorhabditis spiculigera]
MGTRSHTGSRSQQGQEPSTSSASTTTSLSVATPIANFSTATSWFYNFDFIWLLGHVPSLVDLYTRYKKPIFITENGAMDAQPTPGVYPEGLNDVFRTRYIKEHITAVGKALKNGVDIMGYTVWSLMDNFEWTAGLGTKFGLYHVDFTSPAKTRTPKASAIWYKNLVAQNKIDLC